MSEPSTSARDPLDAKAWFYLDHRDDIETWAGLRSDGKELVDRRLMELLPQVQQLAEDVGAVSHSSDLDGGSWPTMGLRRPQWTADGTVVADVVLQWERSRLLRPGSNEWPYIAVRMPEGLQAAERTRVNEALRPLREGSRFESSRSYALWRYVRPSAGRVDPDELSARALDELRGLWSVSAPLMDGLYPAVGAAP